MDNFINNPIVYSIAIILIYIYLIYRFIDSYNTKPKDSNNLDFSFPSYDWIYHENDGLSFKGSIIGRVFAESEIDNYPMLIAKGIINDDIEGYIYFLSDKAHKREFNPLKEKSNYLNIKESEFSFDNIFISHNDGFTKVEDEEFHHEMVGQIKLLLEIDEKEDIENGLYHYDIDSYESKPKIRKITDKLWQFPINFIDYIRGGEFKYIELFSLFILFIFSIRFTIHPDREKLNSIIIDDITVLTYTISASILYFLIYYIFKKDYLKIFYAFIYGFIFGLFILTPITLSTFYIFFTLNKKEVEFNLKGYYSYYITYTDRSFKSNYGWFDLKYIDDTSWEYGAYFKEKEEREYANKIYNYIETKPKDAKIINYKKVNKVNCSYTPCRVITPYDIEAKIHIKAYEWLGALYIQKVDIIDSKERASPKDRYTVYEIKKEKEVILDIFVASKSYDIQVGDVIAILNGSHVAIDKNSTKDSINIKKPKLSQTIDLQIKSDLRDDFIGSNKKKIQTFINIMKEAGVEETKIYISPIYTLKNHGDIHSDKEVKRDYNLYYILRTGSISDKSVNFYDVKMILEQ